jgi:nicotinamidase-related amidase
MSADTIRTPGPRPDFSYRERPLDPVRTALLLIDLQNLFYNPAKHAGDANKSYYYDRMARTALPHAERLIAAFRAAHAEVIHVVVESLTRDGRDRGLELKISDIHAPKGSWEAQVIDRVRPMGDEIVVGKTATGVFNSTNIESVLRNLGINYLVVAGVLTDHCVESAVRAASDRGFLVTLAEDACATYTQERHDLALPRLADYCRIPQDA